MRKKTLFFILFMIAVIGFSGCKKNKGNNGDDVNNDNKVEPTVMATPVPTPDEVQVEPEVTTAADSHEGEARSMLSGEWIPEESANRRPFAIQFSNFKKVSNQWGIGQADIVYEAIVEGGITRILGIFDDLEGDRIGSMRSSRHYFVSVADEYDAIYIHYGKTKYAVAKLKELAIDNLDGESGIGDTVFYRDKSMKAPHNAFTSLDGIYAGIKEKGYDTKLPDDHKAHFSFYEEDTELNSDKNVDKISFNYSSYNSPYMEYDESDKLYYSYQFGGPHVDSNTGEQLKFKNIIVQFVKERDIDKNDYQTMDFADATGTGYYITNGKMVPITWKKNEAKSWMRYYDENGNELTLNTGKTYISLFPDNRMEDVVIK